MLSSAAIAALEGKGTLALTIPPAQDAARS